IATKNGMIKKSTNDKFKASRITRPLVAMKLKDDDEVISVLKITEDELLTVITEKGMSLTYDTDELSEIGLKDAGVKSINLKDNTDISVLKITEDELIIVITEKGMSLTYDTDELSDIGLKADGVKSINLKDNDNVVMTETLPSNKSVFIVTDRGSVKHMKADL